MRSEMFRVRGLIHVFSHFASDSFFFPIALADVASDEFLRRPRQHMCPAGSGFGQFKRWEWIWTLLKRSRCTVSFPRGNKADEMGRDGRSEEVGW